MAALVSGLLFASCNKKADSTSDNETFSQSLSGADQPTATPSIAPTVTPSPTPSKTTTVTTTAAPTTADTETQTSAITPAPSSQKIPSPTATSTATPTATSQPETKPKPTPTLSPQPKATTTDVTQEELVDSSVLNQDFYWTSLDEQLKKRITGFSYPADDSGSQIHYDDLRYIKLLHYDFEGNVKKGELIVHVSLADEVMEIFYQLYLSKYPMTSVLLIDEYGQSADDTLSMEANNTSAFNYRFVSGTQRLSRHSLGAAIDINPMLNPYVKGTYVSPENGAAYTDRSLDFPGKIDHNDLCYKLFINRGWAWGGDWNNEKDYQHFSKNINP